MTGRYAGNHHNGYTEGEKVTDYFSLVSEAFW